jgi:hypothetical protein
MSLPRFPSSLTELHAAAAADLANPVLGTRLKWAFWHGQAQGRAEAARIAQKHMYDVDSSVRYKELMALAPTMVEAVRAFRPDKELQRLEEVLVESVAMLHATAAVLEILPRTERAPMQAVAGGKR